MKRFNGKRVNSIIFLLYVLIGLVLLYFHEPWIDEANTWLIAKNLNFREILEEVRFDGNPCFYYFFLAIFAKMGLPYIFNNIISFLVSVFTTYLLIYRTKLNRLLVFLLLFSSLFIYYGGVFGRSYCMVNLLFVLITILYSSRDRYIVIFSVLVALLFNTHVMMFGFCFAIFCLQCYRFLKNNYVCSKKKYLLGLIIELLGMIFVVWQLFDFFNCNKEVSYYFSYSISFFIIFFVIFFFSLFVVIKKRSSIYFIFLISLTFQFLGQIFVSHNSIYINNLLFLNLFYLSYFCKRIFKYINLTFGLICLFFFIICFRDLSIYYYDVFYNFSDSGRVSKYISKNVSTSESILCVPTYLCTSIIAYLPDYDFIDLFGERILYMNYGNYNKDLDLNINKYVSDYNYVIIGNGYKELVDDSFRLLYTSSIQDSCRYCNAIESYNIFGRYGVADW